MFNTSPGATRMTAYGPEGEPGTITDPPLLVVAVAVGNGGTPPGVGEGRFRVGVADGRDRVNVAVGFDGVGVARMGVGEGMKIMVGVGVAGLSDVNEQALSIMSRRTARNTFFMVFLSLE
jgi:hypothetical protein